MRRILCKLLLFFALLSVFLCYLAIGSMVLIFISWVAMINLNLYLPNIFPYQFGQLGFMPIVLGVIGAVYIFASVIDAEYALGRSLHETIEFVNRFLRLKRREG